MELNEVINLIDKVFECAYNVNLCISVPNPKVYDSDAEGYKLLIKDVSESDLNCIKTVAQKNSLKYCWVTQNSEKVFVIYTPRKA